MRINFFEEFPTDENLRKAELINSPSTVYIAANSLKEFETFEKKLQTINPNVTAGYWPILKESYWISPFSNTHELKNILDELTKRNLNKTKNQTQQDKTQLPIMLDLELPILKKSLFLKNSIYFFKNKKLIKKLLTSTNELNIDILTAEYPLSGNFFQTLLKLFGISYSCKKYNHKKIIMYYSSMIKNKFIRKQLKKFIIKQHKKYGDSFQVGIGTTATGILGNEPIISKQNLKEDLNFLKTTGINTAVIFRLGGLNEKIN